MDACVEARWMAIESGDAESYTFADLDGIRDEELDDLEDQIADLISARDLRDWDIDLRDVTAAVVADANTRDSLVVLRGDFIFEDVKGALDDDGFSERAHLDVSLWSKSRGGRSVALVGDGVIVLGEDDRVREAIEVLVEGTGSIDEEEEVGDIVRALGETVLYMVDTRCDYRRCSVWGGRSAAGETGHGSGVCLYVSRRGGGGGRTVRRSGRPGGRAGRR